ncbi:MAG: hypothetical protein ABSA70_17370 [Terriglobia bacterium]
MPYFMWTAEQARQYANPPRLRKKKKESATQEVTEPDSEYCLAANPEWEKQRKLERAKERQEQIKDRTG